MKKIISGLFLTIITSLIILIFVLSTIGIKTNKFNKLISYKISQINSNINLKLNKIIFKLDIKELSLFLETTKSQINYGNIKIPTKNIKVYINFISIINLEPKIKKINLILNKLDIVELKKLSPIFKPSNYINFLNNNLETGYLNLDLEVYLNENNLLYDFIARGSVSNLKANIFDDINLKKFKFNFIGDKTDFLIKNIFGETSFFTIKEGDVRVELLPEISIKSNFKSSINYKDNIINYKNKFNNFKFVNSIKSFTADLNNIISINFDKTYKIKKYNYQGIGKIDKVSFDFEKPIKAPFSKYKINHLSLNTSNVRTNFSKGKMDMVLSGEYSLNKGSFLNFNLENYFKKDSLNLKLNADYSAPIYLEPINYIKKKDIVANLFVDLNKNKNNIQIKKINFSKGNDYISFNNLNIKNDKLLSFKKVSVNTSKDGKKNNEFSILNNKKIIITGSTFDASKLSKILKKDNSKNVFSSFNKDIQIELKNVIAPLSENLKNFTLIGKIENGKFSKISSKGDYGNNNFLDIKLEKNKKTKQKTLEIYSDLTHPLLADYSFFNGLRGGKLLFYSVVGDKTSNSKLKIENFKVIKAPGVVKLLSLADLNGLADLAEGEGISFDTLEISMSKKDDLLKLNEIVALGSSISVLMEGYQSKDLTSIRGTLVPAKALNKLISKIPVIGDLVIPKEAGEGLFGISFKMKGPPGKIKTTINPIKTLTPRFIQKIIDKKKQSK